jgi:hypothetical protein
MSYSVRDVSEPVVIVTDTVSPAAGVNVGTEQMGFEFDKAQDAQAVCGSFRIPRKIDLSAATLTLIHELFISVIGAAAANVRFEIVAELWRPGAGGLVSTTTTLATVVLATNTLGQYTVVSWSLAAILATPALADDKIFFRIRRLGTDGADSFTGRVAIPPEAQLIFGL